MKDEYEITAVSCKICGVMTENTGTELCNNCYEIDRRIGRIVTKQPTFAAKRIAELVKARLGIELVIKQ